MFINAMTVQGVCGVLPAGVRAVEAAGGPQQLAEGVHRLGLPRGQGQVRLRQDPPGPSALQVNEFTNHEFW